MIFKTLTKSYHYCLKPSTYGSFSPHAVEHPGTLDPWGTVPWITYRTDQNKVARVKCELRKCEWVFCKLKYEPNMRVPR